MHLRLPITILGLGWSTLPGAGNDCARPNRTAGALEPPDRTGQPQLREKLFTLLDLCVFVRRMN